MREMHREPEVPEARVPVVECLDGPARKKWHPPECLFCKSENRCKFGEKCSYAHRQVDEQPNKRYKKNGDISAVAVVTEHERYDRTERPVLYDSSNTRQMGCVFQDMEPPKSSSILRKSSDIR